MDARAWAVLAVVLAQGCALTPQPQTEWERQQAERNWKESEVAPPAFPRDKDLIRFFVSSASSFEFFIDGTSLAAGEDGVVRYVLVAISAQGARSVSYEGIRCSTVEYRIYATGMDTGAGAWTRRASPWRPIEKRNVQRWHNVLHHDYFCPLGNPVHSAEEGVDALRRGGHPSRAPSGN